MRRLAAAAAILVLRATVLAQGSPVQLFEDTRRLPDVPMVEAVTGFALGAEPTTHAETAAYVRALAAASPRAVHVPYGESWEGRSLDLLVISAPRHLARLEEIRRQTARLADPRGATSDELAALCAELPATSWLAYSVHGDEASTTDAALWLAWHLCSADGDPIVDRILEETLVVIDPLQNPDGRERFVHHARQTRGRWPDASPDAAVRDQPWPGGRSNHALCDMNRDWFGLTQPETRARVRAFQDFWPQLFVDVHEMGSNSTYYFGPPALPHNPEVTEGQHAWLERYGRENARWFDERGFDYFTRELFDLFYPGYGDSWPTFQGAVAMTYEVASARGLAVDREDGTRLTFPDTVRQHAVASLASCATTADNREAVLQRFVADRLGAVEAGRDGATKEFVLLPSPDPGRASRLAERLAFQGIEVRRLESDHRHPGVRRHGAQGDAAAAELPAGSYIVRLDQPSGRLARVLISRHQEMDADFVAEQVARQKDRRGTEIYDVTAWSVPLLYGVDCLETDSFTTAATATVAGNDLAEPVPAARAPQASPRARVAYVVPSGQNATAAVLADLLRHGHRVLCAGESFRIGERSLRPGSLIVKVDGNGEDVHDHVLAAAQAHGVEVLPRDSSWVDDGVHFGSNRVRTVRAPRVALAWDRPTSPYSAGAARFVLEERYGVPVSVIRASRLARAELERFDVLVLPDGSSYAQHLGSGGASAIGDWVRRGGTLVTLGGGATRWLTGEGVDLLASAPEKRNGRSDEPGDEEKKAQPEGTEDPDARKAHDIVAFDYERAIEPEDEDPFATPGAILAVEVDTEHFVGFGLPPTVHVVSTDRDIYAPVKLDRGRNVGVFAARDAILQSGFAWEEKLDQLARKPFVVHQPHGEGHVVAFAEDPNFRGFSEGTDLLWINAVLLGPAF
jgi:hypothetical protein